MVTVTSRVPSQVQRPGYRFCDDALDGTATARRAGYLRGHEGGENSLVWRREKRVTIQESLNDRGSLGLNVTEQSFRSLRIVDFRIYAVESPFDCDLPGRRDERCVPRDLVENSEPPVWIAEMAEEKHGYIVMASPRSHKAPRRHLEQRETPTGLAIYLPGRSRCDACPSRKSVALSRSSAKVHLMSRAKFPGDDLAGKMQDDVGAHARAFWRNVPQDPFPALWAGKAQLVGRASATAVGNASAINRWAALWSVLSGSHFVASL